MIVFLDILAENTARITRLIPNNRVSNICIILLLLTFCILYKNFSDNFNIICRKEYISNETIKASSTTQFQRREWG